MAEENAFGLHDWKSKGDLLPDEDPMIHDEIRRVLGEDTASQWVHEENIRFGGKTPEQVIKDGEVHWVRDVLRSYLYIGSS